MKYIDYSKFDTQNGTGARCVIWVSRCSHGCEGCFNKNSWGNVGNIITREFKDQILQDLSQPYIKGLTWSGGDPLHKSNLEEVLIFSREVKTLLPNKDIWLWTGYTLEEIQNDLLRSQILDVIDVLVDGKYIQSLRDTSLIWRGSTNQHIWKNIKGDWVVHEDN
jgi:anaerobic ribonucleoside-triphosphate reductase activating protein